LISKDFYYRGKSDKELRELFKGKIAELRLKVNYKPAFDIIASQLKTDAIIDALSNEDGKKFSGQDSGVLESFSLHRRYSVYQFSTFDDNDTLLLIAEYAPGVTAFFLISQASPRAELLDKFELPRPGSLTFKRMNGGTFLMVESRSTGSGFYGHHVYLLTVNKHKFTQQYHGYLSTMSSWDDTTTRTLSDIKYQDINNDGSVDLVVTTKKDLLDANEEIDVFIDGELEKAKTIQQLSITTEKYIWQKRTLSFQLAN